MASTPAEHPDLSLVYWGGGVYEYFIFRRAGMVASKFRVVLQSRLSRRRRLKATALMLKARATCGAGRRSLLDNIIQDKLFSYPSPWDGNQDVLFSVVFWVAEKWNRYISKVLRVPLEE